MRWLPNLFSKADETRRDTVDGLNTLVRAAQEDEEFRKTVLAVLSASPERREELLHDLCAAAGAKRSTSHFVGALDQLRKEEVRYRVLREIAP